MGRAECDITRHPLGGALTAAWLLLGCGGARPAEAEVFRQIQAHEASIARDTARLGDPTLSCERARRLARARCHQAEALCAAAAQADDADARARCDGARRTCASGSPPTQCGAKGP